MKKEVETSTNIVRQGIVGLAQEMREKGLSTIPNGDDPLSKCYIPQSQEAIDAWNANKRERNAIAAVLIDRVIYRAIAEKSHYPPYGLVNWRDPNKALGELPSYLDLGKSMEVTMDRALDSELDEWERLGRKRHKILTKFSPNKLLGLLTSKPNSSSFEQKNEDSTHNPIQEAYMRVKEIMAFRKKYKVGNPRREPEVRQMLRDGIGTASLIMATLLDVIPKVYTQEFPDKNPNVSDLMEIAKNSYYLLVESAAEHLYRFDRRMGLLGEDEVLIIGFYRFQPDKFIIRRTRMGGLCLAVKEDVREQLKNDFNFIPDDYSDTGPETGCPALVPFDGKSAIKKLWEWHLEIAGKIYNDQHQ